MNNKRIYKKRVVTSLLIATLSTQVVYPVLAAPTRFSGAAVKTASVEADVATVRARLHNQIVGFLPGEQLDLSSEQMQTYVATINETARKHWESMIKHTQTDRAYLWGDKQRKTPYADKMYGGEITENFSRIHAIAKAYATNGTDFYQDAEVREELILALDFLIADKWYPKATGCRGNWWDWEIGVPKALTQTIILLEDYLTEVQIKSYVDAMKIANAHVMKESDTPSNLSDKALQALYIGAIDGDAEMIKLMGNTIKRRLFTTVNSGNGFYTDGSYIDHTNHAYTGGYGIVLMSAMSRILPMISGTQFEIISTDGSHNFFNDRIFDAFEPISYNGLLMQLTSGRGATRINEQDHEKGKGITSIVAVLSKGMKGEAKIAAQRYVKEMISANPDFILNHSDIYRATAMLEIWNDDSIQPRGPLNHHKRYPVMDKVVHHKDTYSFALAMHSNRIANAESINNEGYKTWNTADGMTFIYNQDYNQFNEGWYPTIDQNRMPGTTTENAYRNPTKGMNVTNPHSWVGGTELYNEYGVSGMHLRTLNGGENPTKSGTDAKKSYFMFDKEIVAVGTDITSTTGNTVETIVENRKLKQDASNTFSINGVNVGGTTGVAYDNRITSEIKGKTMTGVEWAHLEGNVEGAGIGYYFPQATDLKVLVEPREYDWKTVNNGQAGLAKHHYATLLFDHGQNPAGESYQYVLLPGKSASETQAYKASPQVEILAATSKVHAVTQKQLGITGYNFWEAANVGDIQAETPCSVMIGKNDPYMDISISDPTQRAQYVTIVLKGNYEVLEKDGAVSVNYVEGGLRVSVDTVGAKGQSYKLKLKEGNKAVAATSIKINGNSLEDFNPNISMYTVKLPYGTTTLPRIEVASEHTVEVILPEDLTGTAVVTLTSITGEKGYYYISFDVETQWLKVSSEQTGNWGMNTVDGVEGTRWASEGRNEWIQYYIGEDRALDTLGIKFYYPNTTRKYTYSLQVSEDERNWTTLYRNLESRGKDEGIVMFNFDTPVNARFVRIVMHGSNEGTWNNIDEVMFELANRVVSYNAAATLEGVDEVAPGTVFELVLGLEEAEDVYAQDITLTYDQKIFELLGVTGRGMTQILDTTHLENGMIRVLAFTQGSIRGRQELLTLSFKARDRQDTQTGKVKVETITLGHVVDHVSTTSSALGIEKYIEVVYKAPNITVPEDTNQDGDIDVLDLALVAYYYQIKEGDTNWDEAKVADVTGDGIVNIYDLTYVARKILENK